MTLWNPSEYLQFSDHRLRPALDLLSRIGAIEPDHIIDLGCGPGNVSLFLSQRWPAARLVLVDNSPEMLAQAAEKWPEANILLQDIARWRPDRPPPLIFSNAALQWLDGHDSLFPALLRSLAPGGVLAVQMPRSFAQPSHVLLRDTVLASPFAKDLQKLLRGDPVAPPDYYFRLLSAEAASIDLWETDYLQILQGEDPVLDWMRGTALRPILSVLDLQQQKEFVADYRERLRLAYPREADGSTVFPFRRLFMVVVKRFG